MAVIENIKKEKLEELVLAGYITDEQARQIFLDAEHAQIAKQAKKNIADMRHKDFDRLMRTPPGPTRSRRNRKQTKGG